MWGSLQQTESRNRISLPISPGQPCGVSLEPEARCGGIPRCVRGSEGPGVGRLGEEPLAALAQLVGCPPSQQSVHPVQSRYHAPHRGV